MLLSYFLPLGLCQDLFVGFWIHLGFLPTPRPSVWSVPREESRCLVCVAQEMKEC